MYVVEAIDLLENMAEAKGIKDVEMDVIGELLSNFYVALEVAKSIKESKLKKNAFG